MKPPRVATKQTLAEFAAEHKMKRGPRCSVCLLPPTVLKELHAGKLAGHTNTVLTLWLQKIHGYTEMNRQRLENHFQNKHEQK